MLKPFVNDCDGRFINTCSLRFNRNLNGNISYPDVLEMIPFDNGVVEVEIKGKDLKAALNFGMKTGGRKYPQYYFKDANIDDNKKYKIITSDFIAAGKDGFVSFKNSVVVKKATESPVQLLLNTIKNYKVITDENLKIEKL